MRTLTLPCIHLELSPFCICLKRGILWGYWSSVCPSVSCWVLFQLSMIRMLGSMIVRLITHIADGQWINPIKTLRFGIFRTLWLTSSFDWWFVTLIMLDTTDSALVTSVDHDQPAHPCSLINICTVRYSVSIFSVSTPYNS